ncbi:MAG: CDP-glycerol glycerophosphotransferase family protein [Clostridia bacterium]|nr:CDP-glycerol glycerophosphotransferase family protein [Clostridia bacterium]
MIKDWLKKFFLWLPGKRYIVFESQPDLSDSTVCVYEELRRRGFHRKYRMVWWLHGGKEQIPTNKKVIYLEEKDHQRLYGKWILFRAKCFVTCNGYLETCHKDQTSFFLTHGMAIKDTAGYRRPLEGVQYYLCLSDYFVDVMAKQLWMDSQKAFSLGLPRNDVFKQPSADLHPLFGRDFDKIVVWYPTYRQGKNDSHKVKGSQALPILHDAEQAQQLNEYLKENRVLLVLKPHFAQDLTYIKKIDLSNIVFIGDDFFVKNKISSYHFVGSCDAMITDYSSIYYDYLLCNKPVAAVWEDIEDFRRELGFAVDIDEVMKGAFKIYTLDDFKKFVQEIATGKDSLKTEREAVKKIVLHADDDQSTRRVTDFIIEKAGL